jgi:hypothetical protein
MKRQTKLDSTGQQQEQTAGQIAQQKGAHEFATAEELLRHDAAHTRVPGSIAQRLQKSTESLPSPTRSWWRRFFKS